MRFVIPILPVFLVVFCSPVFAQDKESQQEKDGVETELFADLKNGRIKFSDTDKLLLQFDKAFRSGSEGDLHRARTTLSGALVHLQRFDEAVDLLKKGFDYQLSEFDKTQDKKHLTMMYFLTQELSEFASRSSKPEIEPELLDVVASKLREQLAETDKLSMNWRFLMRTLNLRCRTLEADQAKPLLDAELKKAKQLYSANKESRFAVFGYLDALKSKAIPPYVGGKLDMDQVKKLLRFVTDLNENKGVHKIVWGLEYYQTCQFVIDRTQHEFPDETRVFIDDAIAVLKKAGEDDLSFERMFDFRVAKLERSKRAIKGPGYVGKPAPDFDAIGWVNGAPAELKQLRGSVVLLDFTAVWCGPCIQQFPDLKLLHKKHADDGLAIISVTSPYNYVWDEDANNPKKSDEDVKLEDEIEMLKKFVSTHELPFRLMVVKQKSELNKTLGVSSIPHAVVIDQQGVVQLVCKGNTRANAEAIESKINELLSN